jgi:NIPSNAP protein
MKWLMGTLIVSLSILGAATFAGRAADDKKETKRVDNRVFELRTYHAAPGKLKALEARFRDHTMKLFEKHGITNIGYWTELKAKEGEQKGEPDEKLIYIIAFPSKEAADKSWKEFMSDPDWMKVREESEKDGKLLREKNPVESVYMNPTDFSPIK